MKRLIWGLAIISTIACTADMEDVVTTTTDYNSSEKIINSSTNAQSGELLVRFDPSAESRLAECATRAGATRSGVADVDAVLDNIGGYAIEPVFVVTEKNRDKVYAAGMHLWYIVKFDKKSNLDAAATDLAKVGEVNRVEFVHHVKKIAPHKPAGAAKSKDICTTRAYSTLVTDIPFNDSYTPYLWALDNQGTKSQITYYGSGWELYEPIVEADVNAVPAWKLCKGDPSIVVAVVDEGIMYSHEDLDANYFINQAELNGISGKDDDSNGYVDDIYGYNFVSMNNKISWSSNGDSGHGTHVAGIISAINNNGKGVSSIAGGSGNNDGVKVFSSQIFNGNNGSTSSNTARSIQYAADRGAHILQCSWGYEAGSVANDNEFKYYVSVEADAIDYFIKNGGTSDGPIDGGLAIFAVGNESYALPSYPSAYEPCIAVASLNPALKPAYYTNYNYGTDIVAPGGESLYDLGDILSTVPSSYATHGTTCYAMMQGTSMACPMVSGVAALGLSYAKKLGKRYTAKEFRSMLLSATNSMDPYLTGGVGLSFTDGSSLNINYPDYKGKLGAGYIDAYKLLLQVEGTPYVTIVAGKTTSIDLSQYFGTGIGNATFSKYEVSTEDKNAVGLSNCSYSNGKLNILCTKSGVATVTVTMLVGGGSKNDSSKPLPTEISKSFVVMVRSSVASNNGWL